jgi:hypothetical protein
MYHDVTVTFDRFRNRILDEGENRMNLKFLIPAVLGCAAFGTQAQELMVNGSFETPGPGFVLFDSWENYGNVFENDPMENTAHDGAVSAKMFGQFSGSQNDQVLLQTVTGISESTTYTLSAYTQQLSTDPVGDGNLILLQLNFQNAAGANLETIDVVAMDSSTPLDTWELVEATGIAPVGTTQILVAVLHLQLDGLAGGASHWDSVSLMAGEDVCTNPADLNGDGKLDFFDVSLFLSAFAEGCP